MKTEAWGDVSPRMLARLRGWVTAGVLGSNVRFVAGRSEPSAAPSTGVIDALGGECLTLLSSIFGSLALVDSSHDGHGGPEAEALIRLRSAGAEGVLILSRLRPLGERIEVGGEAGWIRFDVRRGKLCAEPPELLAASEQPGGGEPQRDAAALLREIQARAKPLCHPWELPSARTFEELRDKRVFVAGSTGFIGARLVEKLAENGARVTAAVRDPRRAARIARLGVELAVTSDNSRWPELLRGHDAVVNLAHDFTAAVEKNGALAIALAEACEAENVPLLVQASSIAVYDDWPGAALDEDSPSDAPGHSYKELKRAIERELIERQEAGRLRTILLQPTIVYGAFSKLWTDCFAERFRVGDVAVPEAGLCEGVHVDDLADAIMAALVRPEASGRYIVSGPAPFAWREMLAAYAGACEGWGALRTEPLAPGEGVLSGIERARRDALARLRARLAGMAGSSLRRLDEERMERLRSILIKASARGKRPLYQPAAENPRLYANQAAVSTARVRRDLIEPVIGIKAGADLVQSYLRWRYCPFAGWLERAN